MRISSEWNIVFREKGEDFALCLRSKVLLEADWLKAVNENLDEFAKKANAHRAVLVANEKIYPKNSSATEDSMERFIIEADPDVAAEKAFKMLNPSRSDQGRIGAPVQRNHMD